MLLKNLIKTSSSRSKCCSLSLSFWTWLPLWVRLITISTNTEFFANFKTRAKRPICLNVVLAYAIYNPPTKSKIFNHFFRHFQKPGTPYSMVDISNWAKRPFPGENIFIVGEAFHPFRGWCEGSIESSQNALRDGWGIQVGVAARAEGRTAQKEDLSQLIKSKSMARAWE